jgi:alpha-glucosidase (family GH31 glycosyl hydrolase)
VRDLADAGFRTELSAEEGNIGMPYVTDDIGSYNGVPGNLPCGTSDYQVTPAAIAARVLPDDLYARWIQLGTFQPLDRLHSNHGERLPWEYGPAADQSATRFLQLREALNPYIYTLAWRAFATGLPITGGLYLQWPGQPAAYENPSEYTFGPNMIVAPVTAPGDPALAKAWIPPGQWLDYFTGRRYRGPATVTLSVPLSQMPVFVRAGAIIPTEPYTPFTPDAPNPSLIVTIYPGAHGRETLYDDAGADFGYKHHQYTLTTIDQTERGTHAMVTISAAIGHFPGAVMARSWQLRILDLPRPKTVTLEVGRRSRPLPWASAGRGWTYDASVRTVSVETGPLLTGERASIVVR